MKLSFPTIHATLFPPPPFLAIMLGIGIGLQNVQKRLQLLYRGKHELKMSSERENFTVLLEIDLQPINEKLSFKKIKKTEKQYELA